MRALCLFGAYVAFIGFFIEVALVLFGPEETWVRSVFIGAVDFSMGMTLLAQREEVS